MKSTDSKVVAAGAAAQLSTGAYDFGEHPGAPSPDGSPLAARLSKGVVRLLNTATFE